MHPRTLVGLALTSVLLTSGTTARSLVQVSDPGDSRVEELRRLVEDGFYREAEEEGRVLLEELRAEGADEDLCAAEARQWLAAALRRTRSPRGEETLLLARQALDAKRELLGVDDPGYAVALQELATLLTARGETQSARELLAEALAIQERHGPPAELGLTLARLGVLASSAQDLAAAEVYFRQAAEVLAALPAKHVNDSWRLEGEANLAEARGGFADALEKRRQSLALREEVLRPDHPLVGQSCYEVARSLYIEGDFTSAKEYLERALPILRATWDARHRRVLDPLLLQAQLYELLGAAARARETYESALELVEGAESVPVLLGMARSLSGKEGRLEEGLRGFRRALELARELGTPAEADLADGLISYGDELERAGRPDGAEEAYDEARAILERRPASDGLLEMKLLSSEAALDLRYGRGEEARASAGRCVEIQEQLLGQDHLRLMGPLLNLAKAHMLLGDVGAASAAAARVESISRQNLLECFDGLEGALATRYAGEARGFCRQAISIVLEGGLDDPQRNEWILDTIIRRRALVLEELARRAQVTRTSDDPEARRLAQELQCARSRLANLVYRVERPSPDYRNRLDEAQREKERLESSLARMGRAPRAQAERDRIGLAEVRAHLPRGKALVSYFVALERAGEPEELPIYLAAVLAASDAPVRIVRLGEARAVEAEVEAWRVQLLRFDAGAEERLREVGRNVRAHIWDPVLDCTRRPQAVLVVPDGVLHRLSFAALPSGEGRYLIEEEQAFRYLSTERELVPVHPPVKPGQGLLAVGVPEPGQESGARARPALAEAEREARGVFELWNRHAQAGPDEARLLIGPEATEEAILREAAGKRALHVASHGFSRRAPPSEPLVALRGEWELARLAETSGVTALGDELAWSPLLGQGLLLAPSAAEAQGDGYLSAEELAGFDLDGVEWAVLAACSSGEGPIESGEGVFGLQRALQLAGVRTTVTSLWPVEDAATREWTTAFYAACLEHGRSAADASAEAARVVLASRRSASESTHPFFWAAFVAAGGSEGVPESTREDAR